MKPFTTILSLAVTFIVYGQNSYFGTYVDHFRNHLTLETDSSFYLRQPICTSARTYTGKYKVKNDTIYLFYNWNFDNVSIKRELWTFNNQKVFVEFTYKLKTKEGYTYQFDSIVQWFAAQMDNRGQFFSRSLYWESKLFINKDKIWLINSEGKIDRKKKWNFYRTKRFQSCLSKEQ